MVKIPQITTSHDEVSLSRHPRRQCNTFMTTGKVDAGKFTPISIFMLAPCLHKLQVIRSCACTLHVTQDQHLLRNSFRLTKVAKDWLGIA